MTKSTTSNPRADRINYLVDLVKTVGEKITPDVLNEDAVRHAVDGILNKRTGRILANAPTFRKRPLASLLYRHIQWHRGSGNLHGMFSVKWDAGFLARYQGLPANYICEEERANDPYENDSILVSGLSESELHDRLETTALILTYGKSPALDKCRKPLHGS